MALLITVGAFAALELLAFSGISHAWHHVTFGQLLAQQGVWSSRTRSVVLMVTIGIECLLGIGGLLILVAGLGTLRLAQAIFAASTVLFLVYLAFAAYLVRRRPGAPCACGSTHEVVNSWTVGRAGMLAAAAFAASIAPAAAYGPPRPGMYGVVTVLGSMSLAVILWTLPGALEDPTRRPADQHARSMEAT
jgi:hypothetical protein